MAQVLVNLGHHLECNATLLPPHFTVPSLSVSTAEHSIALQVVDQAASLSVVLEEEEKIKVENPVVEGEWHDNSGGKQNLCVALPSPTQEFRFTCSQWDTPQRGQFNLSASVSL